MSPDSTLNIEGYALYYLHGWDSPLLSLRFQQEYITSALGLLGRLTTCITQTKMDLRLLFASNRHLLN